MRALFDVNMLIALFDPDHLFHEKAHEWWSQHRNLGWASCTLTENGLIRILSNPKYSPDRPFTPVEILGRLQEYIHQSDHVLLLESPSLLDETLYQLQPHCRSAEITDISLLGLAVRNQMRLVTFDRGISLTNVKEATSDHLVVLSK